MAIVLIHSLSIKLFKCLMLALYVIVKKKVKKKKLFTCSIRQTLVRMDDN